MTSESTFDEIKLRILKMAISGIKIKLRSFYIVNYFVHFSIIHFACLKVVRLDNIKIIE